MDHGCPTTGTGRPRDVPPGHRTHDHARNRERIHRLKVAAFGHLDYPAPGRGSTSRINTGRAPYRSDVSDAHWALIEPVFTTWPARRTGPGTAARVHDLREIVNATLYVNRIGIPWEYLPHDFPPYKTVYDYYAKWEADRASMPARRSKGASGT
jgi:hypothetical protein